MSVAEVMNPPRQNPGRYGRTPMGLCSQSASGDLRKASRRVTGMAWFARTCEGAPACYRGLLARVALPRDLQRELGLHMPHTSTGVPSNSSLRWKIFSFHGFALRSKITRWPASAPHRSM